MVAIWHVRVYLDNCCLNRPFDNQDQLRIRLETEAKLDIQARLPRGELELAWSYILDFENAANPLPERQEEIAWWREVARVDVGETPDTIRRASQLVGRGLAPKDALHVACAIEGRCDVFLTTDDRLLRNLARFRGVRCCNPVALAMELGM
jgi:predicted nucleic acid-binding protein